MSSTGQPRHISYTDVAQQIRWLEQTVTRVPTRKLSGISLAHRLTTKDRAVPYRSREGIEMVYVIAIIANGLLATLAYLVVTWIWDE